MAASGTLNVEGTAHPVHGEAWMDRQWGDFLVLGGGGWDWFAGNLRDGRDVTVSVIRDASGAPLIAYGTLVQPDAEPVHLPSAGIDITASGTWTSPRTGVRYPAGWRLRVPAHRLDLEWVPLLADQELDARASSGVIYWEGAVRLADPMGNDVGRGYVELTGYTVPK
jgi:predicted secreted hydrolase